MTGTEKIAGKRAFKALTYNGPPESFVAITAISLSRGGMGSLIGMFEMTMDSIKSFLSFFLYNSEWKYFSWQLWQPFPPRGIPLSACRMTLSRCQTAWEATSQVAGLKELHWGKSEWITLPHIRGFPSGSSVSVSWIMLEKSGKVVIQKKFFSKQFFF